MFDWDRPRNPAGVRVLLQLGAEYGLSPAACLAGTPLRPEAMLGPEPRGKASARHELQVIRNVVNHCGFEPGFGVEVGRRYCVALHGPWGLAMLSSRTLRDAAEVALRCEAPAFGYGAVTFVETSGQARVIMNDKLIPEDVRSFLAERILAGCHLLGQELRSAAVPLERIQFRHGRPRDISRYRAVFGREPIFGAPTSELAFDSVYLDLPLPQADERSRSTCEQLCRDLLAQRRARSGLAGTVRDLLVRDPGRIPDQTAVAGALFMSPRTLSRRLQDEGTSFRTLLDEVRQMLSEELLGRVGMTTEQVAARLGYAEPASFTRAFRRWNGCSPREFRRGERAAAS